ncbi:MAG TPA: MFS transporter [Bryobacteraceae bacterium]|nr:MFS transporter [Bryobacteraceae bacterium]
MAAHPVDASSGRTLFQAGLARKILVGFFLSGVLTSFLGAILPVWRHHLTEDFVSIGNYFLAMAVGLLWANAIWKYLLPKRNLAVALSAGCGLACASFLLLAALAPGAPLWWRIVAVGGIGCGSGLLHIGLFQALTPVYKLNPVAALYLSGTFFGLGCVVVALLVAGVFHVYTVPSILIFLAALPGYGAGIFALSGLRVQEDRQPGPSFRQAVSDFRSPGAVLLALLLFFQFGNEWAIAGWLPLYLIRRIGVSPEGSLALLAAYWLALIVGRMVVLSILPIISHGKLLGGSVLAALFGCIILLSTNNRFGASAGILLVGAGFASVYPLVAELIGSRFPYYHPGLFNGIFSFAMVGATLAPWSLGLFASQWGIGVVMLLPLLGTIMAFLLVVLIWAEAKFSRGLVKP